MSVKINHEERVAVVNETSYREALSNTFDRLFSRDDRNNLLRSLTDDAVLTLAFETWLSSALDNKTADLMREVSYRLACKLENAS